MIGIKIRKYTGTIHIDLVIYLGFYLRINETVIIPRKLPSFSRIIGTNKTNSVYRVIEIPLN